jgi:hypothetical protein
MRAPVSMGIRSWCVAAMAVLAVSATSLAGIVGVFQGRIVQPSGAKIEEGVLYVRSRNGMARKVKVEKAALVEYDEDVPKDQRRKAAADSLCDDTLVRVTAEQSEAEDGAWRAIRILIMADPQLESGAAARALRTGFFAGQGTKANHPEQSGGASVKPEVTGGGSGEDSGNANNASSQKSQTNAKGEKPKPGAAQKGPGGSTKPADKSEQQSGESKPEAKPRGFCVPES